MKPSQFQLRSLAAMGRSNDDLKSLRKELRRIRNALLGKREKAEPRLGSF